ncbi:hypothetical protein H9P43_003002 [Blastocladiella emersonii ATCC 22665]|nr:hypothetical protein H9P43_003002 [Blastocladiella emersonii ATCC 22665]
MTDSSLHSLSEKALLMLALILLAFNIAGWMKKREFKYFGETAMFISVGLGTSIIFRLMYALIGGDSNILKDVQLSTSFFYMVLLPPIIFEGGYSVHRMLFFKNVPTILSLAFAGGVFSTVVIAIIMYICTSVMTTPLSMIEALIFGSLISSTDPVSILAMLPRETDRTLYIMIFGESALNDAVSIILYRFFSTFAAPEMGKLTFGTFLLSVLSSIWVFAGSLITGVVVALLFAKLTKHQKLTHEAETYEVIMLLVFAYSSYLLAEILGLTGIISVFFAGVAMAHYAKPNLTSTSNMISKHALRVFSAMCDSFIFMYLGMGLLAFPKAKYVPYVIISAIAAIAAGRCHVFLICGMQNLASRTSSTIARVPFAHQLFLWFSGLRGAVAFALAVQLLDNHDLSEYARSTIFGTAIIVIVTTVFGLNILTPILIEKLPITDSSAAAATAGSGGHGGDDDASSEAGDEALDESEIPPGFFGWAYRLDRDRIRPFFTNLQNGGRGRTPVGGHDHGSTAAGRYAQVGTGEGINLDDLTDGDVVSLTAPPSKVGDEFGGKKDVAEVAATGAIRSNAAMSD